MTRGGLCAVLALSLMSFWTQWRIQPSGAVRSARLPRRNRCCSSQWHNGGTPTPDCTLPRDSHGHCVPSEWQGRMEYSTCQSGCKIAVLCKNRRCGNCNAHKCALPRATLGFCTSTAQRICTISSSTDKNSCHNFVKLSAWWLAFARCFQPHTRRKPHASNYPAVHSDTLYARTHTYIRTHDLFIHEL